jgi:hypothetical protein
MITYYAIVDGKVLRQSTNYERLARWFDAYRTREYRRTETWMGGFIQSFI